MKKVIFALTTMFLLCSDADAGILRRSRTTTTSSCANGKCSPTTSAPKIALIKPAQAPPVLVAPVKPAPKKQ